MLFVAVAACADDKKIMHDRAYALCRDMLSSLSLDTDILKNSDGKPYVRGAGISLSHSHGAVCCAVNAKEGRVILPPDVLLFSYESDFGEIGVDIEFIKANQSLSRIADVFFSSAERDYAVLNGDSGFYTVYTRKEACLKKSGIGLAGMRSTNTFSSGDRFITEKIILDRGKYIFTVCV